MLRILLLILITLFLPLTSYADFYQSIQESNGEYTLTLQIDPSSLKLNRVNEKFTQVELPDAQPIGPAGDPALPAISRFFNVKASEYSATIETSNPVVFPGIKVYPIQPDHKENVRKYPFVYNDKAYAQNQNPSVSLGELVPVGNAQALAVRVNPFARQGDQLILYKTITIHLKPKANATPLLQQNNAKLSTTLFRYHQQNLLISNLKRNLSVPKEPGVVMVISSQELMDDAQSYASLHPEFKTEVVAIKKGSPFSTVKAMISDRYAKGGLDTVVLYGDELQVPGAKWDGHNSDSFYQYLDPTQPYYTQIAIGRIPAQNHNDANFYNNKLAAYLKNSKTRLSKNVMLIAHNEDYPEKYTANQEAIRTAPNPMGFVYNTQYGGANATNDSVIQEASNNYPLINYRGHGDDQSWWSWDKNNDSFDKSQVSLLKNTDDKVSVFFNIACDTGTFESPMRNMSENLLFLENIGSSYRGAIVALGATDPSWTEINNHFDIHLFELMESQKQLPLGHLVALANDKLVLESGGEINDNIKMYVLFGDPLISLW